MSKVLIVDASMVYAANKAKLGHLKRNDGYPTGAVFGFIRMIQAAAKGHDSVAVAFDTGGSVARRNIDPNYKSGREGSDAAHFVHRTHETWPEEICDHKGDIDEWIFAAGHTRAWCEGYEADDVIADLTHEATNAGREVTILSRDHDMRSLLYLDPEVTVAWPKDGTWTYDRFVAEYGFVPGSYERYLALAGDPTDSVPALMSKNDALETIRGERDMIRSVEYERNLALVVKGTSHQMKKLTGRGDVGMLRKLYIRLEFNSLLKKLED